MKKQLLIFFFVISIITVSGQQVTILPDCTCMIKEGGSTKIIPLYGKVKIVDNFEDVTIQIVHNFEDVSVQLVDNFPNSCGKWQIVDNFEDFTVKIVESFPDITIRYVQSFPGLKK